MILAFFVFVFETKRNQIHMGRLFLIHRASFDRLREIFVHTISSLMVDDRVALLEWFTKFVAHLKLQQKHQKKIQIIDWLWGVCEKVDTFLLNGLSEPEAEAVEATGDRPIGPPLFELASMLAKGTSIENLIECNNWMTTLETFLNESLRLVEPANWRTCSVLNRNGCSKNE